MPKKFKKLVVLDPILLPESYWQRLKACCEVFQKEELIIRGQKEVNLKEAGSLCWLPMPYHNLTPEIIRQRINDADAVITCWTIIPDEVLRQNKQIKFLGLWSNLIVQRVNLKLCQELGIKVAYIPDYAIESLAEIVIGGIIAVARNIVRAAYDTKIGKWHQELLKLGKYSPQQIRELPFLLNGKKIGILGFGNVGKRVAELALAFKMDIFYHSKTRKAEWEKRGCKYLSLNNLFKEVEIITVHLPYPPLVKEGFITRHHLSLLRDKAIFVNTASGTLVDEEALFDELEKGRIFAFLDVYKSLPPRRKIKRVAPPSLFTYRLGWFTQEAITYKAEKLVSQVENFLREF